MRRKRILIADYELCNLKFFSGVARQHGWRPLAVDTVGGALSVIEHERPDLAMIDLKFCDGSGIYLCSQVSQVCPVIVVTSQEMEREAKKAGAVRYFKKPLPMDVFVNILNENK